MKRFRLLPCLGLSYVVAVSGAVSGNLTVDVYSQTDVSASATVHSTGPSVTKAATSTNLWDFDFKDKPIISVPIEIIVEQPPAGYQSVPMRFSLPFYAERGEPYPLATAVANDKPNDLEGVFPFLREMSTPQSTFRNSFVLYQRARLLWKTREIALRTRGPNQDDVGLAYWLLYAAADLAKKYLYKPDETVWRTADWIANLPDDRRLYGRVSRATITALLDQLRGVDASFYNSMILRLETDRSTKRDDSCSKFTKLDSEFSELTPEERSRIDPDSRLSIKIKENVTWCAAQVVMSTSGTLSDSQRDELRSAAGAAKVTLDALPSNFQFGRNAKFVKENVKIIESYVGTSVQ
jgi:hypothetical protein